MAGNLIGENSPGESAPATDLVVNVDSIDESGGVVTVSAISGAVGDADRVDAKQFEYDSPFTNLVLNIISTNSVPISGTFQKSGSQNNKPKYTNTTSSNVQIAYNGRWELLQDTEVLATNTNDSPLYNIPFTDWIVLGRDTESLVFTTTENVEFTLGETIQGNISSGEASIVTSANSRITVNNLEQAYVEDELITGESGTIRTVFKTILAP